MKYFHLRGLHRARVKEIQSVKGQFVGTGGKGLKGNLFWSSQRLWIGKKMWSQLLSPSPGYEFMLLAFETVKSWNLENDSGWGETQMTEHLIFM